MYLLRANKTELEDYEKLLNSAREYMRTHGNPDQWSGDYPNVDDLIDDIETLELFAAKDGHKTLGLCKVQRTPEEAYAHLDLPEKYLTLHKVIGSPKRKGMGEWMIRFVQNKRNIPLVTDTHPDNKAMIDCLNRCGFEPIGETDYYDGKTRIVYLWKGDE